MKRRPPKRLTFKKVKRQISIRFTFDVRPFVQALRLLAEKCRQAGAALAAAFRPLAAAHLVQLPGAQVLVLPPLMHEAAG